FWRGRFRAARGDHAGAIADFEVAARKSSVPFRDWAALAELLALVGRDAEAAAYVRLGDALDAQGFVAEREEFRATVLRRSPETSARAMEVMNTGVELMGRGRLKAAEALFSRSIAIDPVSHLAHTNLGIVLAAQGRADEALSAQDRAVALAPGDASPYYWRGRYFAARKDWPSALRDFEAAVQRS